MEDTVRNVIEVLRERGFIEAITSESLVEAVKSPMKVYCGFDPTADSLHLGNLVAIMGLAWFQRYGHTPVAILGGATGMIGDPSGKSTERQLLGEETLHNNAIGIRKNLEAILDFAHPTAKPILLNNLDWFKEISLIRFLRDIGKLFRLGPMLSKDSVKTRLNSEEGMSFTEFSYQTLQGYDFLHLFKNHGVTVQLGGSDQWGNITAGIDLTRKTCGKEIFGITFPLLTKSDGQKFGKSEKGAIWLSPEKTSPYDFYQHLIRTEDADVLTLMRMLTFMEMDEIRHYQNWMELKDYPPRAAQKKLAEEVTRIVHGQGGLDMAIALTQSIAPGAATKLDAQMLEALADNMPSYTLTKEALVGKKLTDILTEAGLQPSKGEARRLIRNGGVYLNNEKIDDENATIEAHHLIDEKLLLIATGKKNKMLLRVR